MSKTFACKAVMEVLNEHLHHRLRRGNTLVKKCTGRPLFIGEVQHLRRPGATPPDEQSNRSPEVREQVRSCRLLEALSNLAPCLPGHANPSIDGRRAARKKRVEVFKRIACHPDKIARSCVEVRIAPPVNPGNIVKIDSELDVAEVRPDRIEELTKGDRHQTAIPRIDIAIHAESRPKPVLNGSPQRALGL
ncbi:hypothetical protein [Bradyrhizobium sp. CCBAU 51627]|uniref:hypothetical protein n=1 Tax=Bradyrhizobium sp. CCBAU 51627 TaxID=1325088 RepID=UPI002305433A|nr:hypothetical protein [Bradyrhizobium sp. CCBAU 51627]